MGDIKFEIIFKIWYNIIIDDIFRVYIEHYLNVWIIRIRLERILCMHMNV